MIRCLELGYDNFDRVTSETTPQGTVNYTFDAAGRRTGMTVSGQTAVSYTYDNADRLTRISQGSAAVEFVHDLADRTTSVALPNGAVTEYAYDAASQLLGITYRKDSNVLGNLTYEYDATGRTTKIGGTFARTGLPQQLASVQYNDGNQMTGFGAQALSYDFNGNLTSDGVNSYTWNARNQLAAISGPDINATFQYDAFGRRTGKNINGTATTFLYDGVNVVQEQTGTQTANILTGAVDEFFVRSDASGSWVPIADVLGSVIGLTDAAGSLHPEYTYEPFGNTLTSGSANENSSQFTGRKNDRTGLYHYRARYYSPTFQRFISQDPIGFAGGDINLYNYAQNAPTFYADPFGLWVEMVFNRRRGTLTAQV